MNKLIALIFLLVFFVGCKTQNSSPQESIQELVDNYVSNGYEVKEQIDIKDETAFALENKTHWIVLLEEEKFGPYDSVVFTLQDIHLEDINDKLLMIVNHEGLWLVIYDGEQIGFFDSRRPFASLDSTYTKMPQVNLVNGTYEITEYHNEEHVTIKIKS